MPEYKVIYFDGPGRAEPIRMILTYGGIKFEDVRLSKEDFLKLKPSLPLGQLPVLEIDGKQIPQSIAICRYLATLVKLSGNDAKENLRIDVAVDVLQDLQKKLFDYRSGKDEAERAALKEVVVNETMPFFLKRIDKIAGENGGYIAINRMTWADVLFINVYEGMVNILEKDIIVEYPNLAKIKSNVLAVPSIKEFIKNRTERPGFYNLKKDL